MVEVNAACKQGRNKTIWLNTLPLASDRKVSAMQTARHFNSHLVESTDSHLDGQTQLYVTQYGSEWKINNTNVTRSHKMVLKSHHTVPCISLKTVVGVNLSEIEILHYVVVQSFLHHIHAPF